MNPLDTFTRQARERMATAATREYDRRLERGEVCATCCEDCGRSTFPPEGHCPGCFGTRLRWVPLEGGRLYAFTTQERALRFRAPAVIGVVEIPRVGLVLGPIQGRMETLAIGQPMRPTVVELDDGARKLHGFEPARARSSPT